MLNGLVAGTLEAPNRAPEVFRAPETDSSRSVTAAAAAFVVTDPTAKASTSPPESGGAWMIAFLTEGTLAHDPIVPVGITSPVAVAEPPVTMPPVSASGSIHRVPSGQPLLVMVTW